LHPPRQPEKLRTAHLPKIGLPMLFFAGTRDPLCDLSLLRQSLAGMTAAVSLHVIEGGDHSFDVPKSLGRSRPDVWNEILEQSAAWLGGL